MSKFSSIHQFWTGINRTISSASRLLLVKNVYTTESQIIISKYQFSPVDESVDSFSYLILMLQLWNIRITCGNKEDLKHIFLTLQVLFFVQLEVNVCNSISTGNSSSIFFHFCIFISTNLKLKMIKIDFFKIS